LSAYNYQMIKSKSGVILAFFLSVASLSGCVGGQGNANNSAAAATGSNRTTENSNSARTNVEELSLLVKVPYDTEDIVWKEYAAAKKVIAVLRFSPANSAKIVAEASSAGAPQNVSVAVETWFPDELTAQSDMSGDNSLKGLAYPATAFYQDPYTTGKITRIESSDYFVLELTAK